MPQNEERSTGNLPPRSENEEPSTQNHDWDDMSPDTKQRFQELARKDTEHRTMPPEMTNYSDIYWFMSQDTTIYQDVQDSLEPELPLHDELRAMSDLLDLEEDYTND